jgi:hypothetical protein
VQVQSEGRVPRGFNGLTASLEFHDVAGTEATDFVGDDAHSFVSPVKDHLIASSDRVVGIFLALFEIRSEVFGDPRARRFHLAL